jgi:hypothetical protein
MLKELCSLVLIIIAVVIPLPEPQDEKWSENDWTTHIAENGEFSGYDTKFRFWDRTRPDLMGEKYVIEIDWSSKWKEGVGQACYYRELADKRGAVILLFPDGINSEKERLRGYRCMVACKGANLDWFFYDCKQKKFIK